MRSTLFYIPHEFLGVPLLGVGWLLFALIIGLIVWALWHYQRGQLLDELAAGWPVWLVAAGLVVFVLPHIEARWPDGEPIGLPVRGYGVMVLLGLFCGIAITLWRGQQIGVSPELIVSLGFWMMIGGVLGARLFFVIQYWQQDFAMKPFTERMVAIVKLTEGGLVIYGGMIGGAIAGALFCRKFRQPVLAMADLITPGFLIGLAFGRIGCLLNGCCFGGACTADLPTTQFPQGSPPYIAQLENGKLLGLTVAVQDGRPTIVRVEPGSIADTKFEAKPGMWYEEQHRALPPEPNVDDPARTPEMVASVTMGYKNMLLTPEDLPQRSLPVHPSQAYSAIDAFLLCLLILCFQPWVPHDGQAFLIAVTLHSVARFLLELIRSDEAGQFGTALTIAQWISIVAGLAAVTCLFITARQPAKRAWAWPAR